MILRKPFAILIKHFKLIHVILTILSFYLIYRTNLLINFFDEYMSTYNSVIGKDLTGQLYSIWMYVALLVVIIGTVIILGLMVFKKKKVKLYIYNIFVYLFVIIVYSITRSTLSSLEVELVDIRTLKMVEDLLATSFIVQIISLIIVAIRATGFNVQKFEFTKDLQELEIEDVDNEEFELNIDLNYDETRRKINRTFRHAKYIYKENKAVLWMLLGVIVGIASLSMYMNFGVYNKLYNEGDAFSTTYFTIQLNESYSSSYDYKGAQLSEEETFVMVKLNIKNTSIKDKEFESARLVLNIDEHYFYHDYTYKQQMHDIGNIYAEQSIPSEFTEYVFIYKIPKDFLTKNIKLIYTDYNKKQIRMKINPTSLDDEVSVETYNIGEKIDFKDSILEDVEVTINNITSADFFKVDYNYCIESNCYPSSEYLIPTLSGNTDKVLLKINGTISEDESIEYIDLYELMKNYGYLEYQINSQLKIINLNTKIIKPTKTTLQNEYYIETTRKINEAEKINLIFKIRNKTYKYVIK